MDVSQLNKRQYFAALMLAAIVQNEGVHFNEDPINTRFQEDAKYMSKQAVFLADCLMEELDKDKL